MEDIELNNREPPPEEEDPAQEEETSFNEADPETLEKLYQNLELPDAPEHEAGAEKTEVLRSELERPKRKKT